MLKILRKTKKKVSGQTLLEYTMVLGVVTLILFAMAPMFQRANQGMIKMVADQIGEQVNSDQLFDDSGHLKEQYVVSRSDLSTDTTQVFSLINYQMDDAVYTSIDIYSNVGFSKTENPKTVP